MMTSSGTASAWLGVALVGGLIAVSCGSSDGGDDSTGSGGSAGAGGTTIQQMPGCTRTPDCNACVSCEETCHCVTGLTQECFDSCQSGMGGAGPGGTGGAGPGGSGPGGSAGDGMGGVGGVGGAGVGGSGGTPSTVFDCFKDIYGGGALLVPSYDQFGPTVGSHCSGTNHQDIVGVEKVAFFGDSITAMDYAIFPPVTATPALIYRLQLGEKLKQKFPGVEIVDCSKDGAKTDDFIGGGNQLPQCFPGVEQKRTLNIITMGGNNLRDMAQGKMGPTEYQPLVDQTLTEHRAALEWLTDPSRFPNGSYVIFGNVYEYTDTSTDMSSCALASAVGLSGTWQPGAGAIIQLAEGYMKMAVETKTDMVFMLENFCGHGFRRDDATLQCYRGPGAELYFDPTCIHPSDAGATALANLFNNVVNE